MKHASAAEVECCYCKKLFLPAKLKVHHKYFCGPNAQRALLQLCQGKKEWQWVIRFSMLSWVLFGGGQ